MLLIIFSQLFKFIIINAISVFPYIVCLTISIINMHGTTGHIPDWKKSKIMDYDEPDTIKREKSNQ